LTLGLAVSSLSLGIPRAAQAADDEDTSSAKASDSDEKSPEATESNGAKKPEEASKGEAEKSDDDAFGHGGQVGLRVGLVAGYRMILRYEDSPLCTELDPDKGTDQQKFCGHAAPLALSAALSYGVADWLEPFAFGRFGLAAEEEAYTKPVLMFGAGLRVYTMSDSAFKIFIEPALGLELEDGEDITGNTVDLDTDLAIHLAAGPTLDFSRNVGVYLTGGVTTTILRALATSLEAELGVQGRY
jgi:hypothetical protein